MIGRKMFILGSGDIGLIMARRMTLEGAKVIGVAEIMPYSNGLTRNVVQCLHDFNIPLYLSHTVSKVIGKDRLEKIVLSQVDDNLQPIPGTEKEFEVDTLLLSVGLIPANELLDQLGVPSHPRTRGALVNDQMETQWDGVFACGNVLHVHDLVDFVSEEGRRAGHGASRYLKGLLPAHDSTINVQAGEGVLYVVPASIDRKNAEEEISLKFRVTKPQQMKNVLIQNDQGTIYQRIKPYLLPAEMETVTIKRSELSENCTAITVSIVERGGK